jgi:hypothetical protein
MLFAACSSQSQSPSQPSAVVAPSASPTATSRPSTVNQQLVFQDQAGTGTGTFAGQSTPFGFWIWCQTALNSNAYGNDCGGSMYFYHLGISTGVDGSISGNTVTVEATPPSGTLSCTFTLPNLSTITPGATNTVALSCSTPAGTGTDSKVSIQVTPRS